MKKRMRWITMTAVLALLLLLGACTATGSPEGSKGTDPDAGKGMSQDVDAPPSSVTKLTPEEAKGKMEQGNVTVVDVRTAEEYKEAHVQGAVLLPSETIDGETAKALLPDHEETLLVYCRSGRRSAAAAEKLAQLGYTRVFDFGGIIDWPYDTETGEFAP